MACIIHKVGYKKGRTGMTMIFIKRIILLLPKQVVNVIDLGYLGIEKNFPEQKSSLPKRKKRNHGIITRRKRGSIKNHAKKRIVIEHTICQIKKI